ncbi:MAG TPA: hypothetical protein VGS07_24150 [Thermoanaerobaculia bacterium]|jgi:hypothetical protein|nr:hypothetical protein [Thermoanaerobaculia bacterium]
MKSDESPLPDPLHAAPADESKPDEDPLSDGGGDRSPSRSFEIFPAPADSGMRGYTIELFGDERGGQIPKRPRRSRSGLSGKELGGQEATQSEKQTGEK